MTSAPEARDQRALRAYVGTAVVLPMVIAGGFEIATLIKGEWDASAVFGPFLALNLYRLRLIKARGHRITLLGSAVDAISGGRLLRRRPDR